MGIFGSDKKESLIAVFNVSSSSVAGALFFHRPDKIPEILTTVRFAADFSSEISFQPSQKSLYQIFEKTAAALKKRMPEARKKLDSAIIVFSSPYCVSQTKIVRFQKEKPFQITKDFLDEIVKGEQELFKNKWQNDHQCPEKNNACPEAWEIIGKANVEIIEHEIMKINLNGYPVKQPLGKYAQKAELFLYISLGIKEIEEKLHESIRHIFGETKVCLNSFPFVAFNVLKSMMDIERGLLLIDIGGEITDLTVIRNGILEETISFPLGENFLIRRIASVFHFSFEESLALLNQYIRTDLHAETHEKVEKTIEAAAEKWCEFFQKSFKALPEFSLSPKNILFSGGKAALALKNFDLCIKEPAFTTQFLLAEAFKNHFIFNKGFKENKDISLMISILFVDKLFLNY